MTQWQPYASMVAHVQCNLYQMVMVMGEVIFGATHSPHPLFWSLSFWLCFAESAFITDSTFLLANDVQPLAGLIIFDHFAPAPFDWLDNRSATSTVFRVQLLFNPSVCHFSLYSKLISRLCLLWLFGNQRSECCGIIAQVQRMIWSSFLVWNQCDLTTPYLDCWIRKSFSVVTREDINVKVIFSLVGNSQLCYSFKFRLGFHFSL